MEKREFEVTWTIHGTTTVSAYDIDDAKERVAELYVGELLDISSYDGPDFDDAEEV